MEYIKNENDIEDGDIIVRIYNENSGAIGIYRNYGYYSNFIYIDQQFFKFEGLNTYGAYSLGLNSGEYKYRYATYQEIDEIISKYGRENSQIMFYLIKYKNKIRYKKLKKLNI